MYEAEDQMVRPSLSRDLLALVDLVSREGLCVTFSTSYVLSNTPETWYLYLPDRREGERCRSFVTEESDLHVGDDVLDIFHVTRLLGMNHMSEVKVGGEGRT